jgi:uncharacterized protein
MALSIRTEFELDCPKSQAWAFLTNANQAVPCFPGAELGVLRDDGFYDGSFGVKLGPMALKFGGKFKVEPLDETTGTLRVQALGQDTKGRGTAKSDVNCQLTEEAGKTRVVVDSKVDLTGSIAQFGRAAGMIDVISKQLLLRFASNVKTALVALPSGHVGAGDASKVEAAAIETNMNITSSSVTSSSTAPANETLAIEKPAMSAPARASLWEKLILWFKKW